MLFSTSSGKLKRVQCPFVSDSEVEKVVSFLKENYKTKYELDFQIDENDNNHKSSDPLYKQALEIIKINQKASVSYIQRKLNIGYNRAAKIIET